MELGVLGPLQVRQYGLPVGIPGAKPRAILTMLGLHGGAVVPADTLVELLWGTDPPRTAAKALQTHISALRRTLGDGFVLTEGTGWTLSTTEIDASRYKSAVKLGREAVAAGDVSEAVERFDQALALWRGVPELPDGPRGGSEKTRWVEGHAALVEDRADALLATGRAAEIIGELEAAVADAPLRERRWGQLMLALYRAGRQGEALGAYQRARALLANDLGVDPGPELRRLEAAIVAQDDALETPVSQQLSVVTRAVTFLLTDIEGSTAAWEADADAMAVALARHDEIVEQVVTARGGRLIKTRGEGDATFSVFDRPSAAAAAAIELQSAVRNEPWMLADPMRIRVALHTGEVELRDGDYFGRAVNRAARLRSLAAGGQILCSGATAELVIDSLADDVVLADLGTRQLRNLPRPEHVFELRLEIDDESRAVATDTPMARPPLPAVLAAPGPFVGRGQELELLLSTWQTTLTAGAHAVLIAGEPGVGKTRLAGEWSRLAYDQGAVVLYGRCDEDLGAPYQPFAEALRSLVPCVGADRLRQLRGVEALLPLVPGLSDVLPDLAAPPRADPDTERYALFDAVVALLGAASTCAPVVLILDDLHWAAKPTLLLLRHLLRFGEQARVQIVGTYRSTDLDRSHPLAAMLADLHRNGSDDRLHLRGLGEDDVSTYVAEAGYDDEELARALASVTGGNPFFLIEALRHVAESGGRWDPDTLPQGVREAVSRRLSRLSAETNKALAAAAVVGSRFALELVEQVVGDDLVDAFDEACKAGIVVEEPGGCYRFNHAIVRQSLLAELASVRRMRLHQRIAVTLEATPGAEHELLAELAYHYFECAWAGNAAKAVEYCRSAADQAMTRLAYEGAAELYDRALHALEELDDELPDRDDVQAELLVARCEALLAAGDVTSAVGAVSQLQSATGDSRRLAAWGACFDGQLSMLTHPERLDEIEAAVRSAADELAELDDAAGEAKAHTVRAGCLARLGRIADCEAALDHALTAARRAREHRRVNAVLANAPLAALWGPNPVPRAGGRCLDVVRLLRITTGSPVVEATSTRCQGVLDAFRGRAAAGRTLIESARRTLTDLGLRHALLEVDHFAGIVELVADDPAAAEPYLRRAYLGFRRMGIDTDTAETAALLARACLAMDRDGEADELCTESQRLAGHALRASIAWRTVRAQLLARSGAHDEARRVAEEAVAIASRTDALVDHGDACLALATVLEATGDTTGARAAAEQAAGLYERKGAAALVEKARTLLGARAVASGPAPEELGNAVPVNACVRVGSRVIDAVNREAWSEVEQLLAPQVSVESRRKIVGFPRIDVPAGRWPQDMRAFLDAGIVRYRDVPVAVRGERIALTRLEMSTTDSSSGAPQDEMLHVAGLDENGRVALQVWFDVEDMEAAVAELDAAHARLARRHSLENVASRADARFNALFADRQWDEIGELFTDDIRVEDRRRGVQQFGTGRATMMAEVRATADVGTATMTSEVVAVRGERLALVRTLYRGRDPRPDAFYGDVLRITEIDADERIAAFIVLDLDEIDAAFEELNARYLAGEAAPYAEAWQEIVDGGRILNRHEPGAMAEKISAFVDHRRIPFAPDDIAHATDRLWELLPEARYRIAAVHALDSYGAVLTLVIEGTDAGGTELLWSAVDVVTFESAQIRLEVYEEDDLAAALARFAELRPQQRRIDNAATRVVERYLAHFASRDWDAIREVLAEDFVADDRRRIVNGIRHGRDAEIANERVSAELGCTEVLSTVIATRGDHLVLEHHAFAVQDRSAPVVGEALDVVEINADKKIAGPVVFDTADFDAAVAELDARYEAGEAAAHARTWSVIRDGYAALNRHEAPATTSDFVSVDHRRGVTFAAGDLIPCIHSAFELSPEIDIHIEAVHQLSDAGAVITHAARGTSPDGFRAEWREVNLLTVDGDAVNRCEIFDETDLETALTRFEQLTRLTPRLENAASRAFERFNACLAARDWPAMAQMITDDVCHDDRRRVVSGGLHRGRDAQIANLRAVVEVGVKNLESTVIATRGERLALARSRVSGSATRSDAFNLEMLTLIETDADNRITAGINFDLQDLDAAFEELDVRYLAGEAAAHANTWSVMAKAYAAFNRREPPRTTHDFASLDHRRVTGFAAGELIPYIYATWDLAPDIRLYVETVHQLGDLGVVVTHAARGTSDQGFDAEWRETVVFTADGDSINSCEIFEEADIDAALARLQELSSTTRRLENAASQVDERILASFAERDWAVAAEMLAEDFCMDDRRPVVGAGVRHGRDAEIANFRAVANLGTTKATPTVVATRGQRVALTRLHFSGHSDRPEAFHTDVLAVIEINASNQLAARTVFNVDDIETAIADLETRFVAGEAAAHAHTWSLVAHTFAALNKHEVPATTPDWVHIDHRPIPMYEVGDLPTYLGATWDLTPESTTYVEAVHRLTDCGAVVTNVARAISKEGFEVEWREVSLITFEGDEISRGEDFDEADLDAALEKFDELTAATHHVGNPATQARRQLADAFNRRDVDGFGSLHDPEGEYDDRRKGLRDTGKAESKVVQAVLDAPKGWRMEVEPVAIRGSRLGLTRERWRDTDDADQPVTAEALMLAELGEVGLICRTVLFDPDDINGAIAELTARWIASGEVAHPAVIEAARQENEAYNRHDWDAIVAIEADATYVNHRQLATEEPETIAGHWRSIRALASLIPDMWVDPAEILAYSATNIISHVIVRGTTAAGAAIELPAIVLIVFDGTRVIRMEAFDLTQRDAALQRFEELNTAPELANAATRTWTRIVDACNHRDADSFLALTSPHGQLEDRRKGLHASHVEVARRRAAESMCRAPERWRMEVETVAIRGNCLGLTRERWRDTGDAGQPVTVETLTLTEVTSDELVNDTVIFDPDDINGALAELTARWIASGDVAHPDIVEAYMRVLGELNRHDWEAWRTSLASATHINHRQLGSGETIADFTASVHAVAALIPNVRVEPARFLECSASAALTEVMARGTSADGAPVEIPMLMLGRFDSGRLTHFEMFDPDQRDFAMARFRELA
ncbi:BTAD domain-containing putative transcriptional regulator [Mycobacterium sp. 3519A]|uniref:BTAD domain-containing putative transcriptional regulator n=1 Tax=Mycobacterium sp. 3519A TaxID=2057184 RepID=UPI0021015488|nr:BTAD domain-containing putative transcriptional regulator [Mycobacterium sp. 3519A]